MPGLSGPVAKPDDQRARRNATIAMTKLPAAGRTGPVPAWPLMDDIKKTAQIKVVKLKIKELTFLAADEDITGRKQAKLDQDIAKLRTAVMILTDEIAAQRKFEGALWSELWRSPQAVEWEKLKWTREVAQYVRWKVLGELGDLKASQEARQLADRLGLSPLSLLRLKWAIVDMAATTAETTRPVRGKGRYGNLRVVDSKAAAPAKPAKPPARRRPTR